ncbi:universal stress protein [Calditrichota bacterium]
MFDVIVCPLDLRERSFQVLPKVGDLARKYGSKLIFLNVNHRFMSEDEMVMLRVSESNYSQMMKDMAVNARNTIEAALKEKGVDDIDHEIVLREGTPGHDIPRIAESLGADLIVLSSTGRDHISEMFLGTTAEAVLHRSKVSVLTIYVDGDEKPGKKG